MSEVYKNRDAKKKHASKDYLNYLGWVVINLNFSDYLFVCLLLGTQFL